MNEDQEILEYLKGVLSAEQELALRNQHQPTCVL